MDSFVSKMDEGNIMYEVLKLMKKFELTIVV